MEFYKLIEGLLLIAFIALVVVMLYNFVAMFAGLPLINFWSL